MAGPEKRKKAECVSSYQEEFQYWNISPQIVSIQARKKKNEKSSATEKGKNSPSGFGGKRDVGTEGKQR